MSHFQCAQSGKAVFAGANKSQIRLLRSEFFLSCQKYIHHKSPLYFRNTEGESHTWNLEQISPAKPLRSFLSSSTCTVMQCPPAKKKKTNKKQKNKKDSSKTNRKVAVYLGWLGRKIIKRLIIVPLLQFGRCAQYILHLYPAMPKYLKSSF